MTNPDHWKKEEGPMAFETHTPRWPRRWPVAVISLPAAVATWSGWVGLGEMTGFGKVKLLPGIWDSLQINTAVTLPVGVEAYAAYALSAALTSAPVTGPTRRFAWISSVCALALGMGAQVAYHLLRNGHRTAAPWQITTFVSCLPVLVLGLSAVLAHMLHRDRTAAVAQPVVAEQVAEDPADEGLTEPVFSHPQTDPAKGPDPAQGVVISLDDAVMSARAAGMSVRAVSDAFRVTRYRVEKLDKLAGRSGPATGSDASDTGPAEPSTDPIALAALNGHPVHADH